MNKRRLSSFIWGLLLISCGLIWLAGNIFPELNINWGILWPLFLFLPGVFLWFVYLFAKGKENDWGILIPANILVFLGLTFFINMFVSTVWDYGTIWALTAFMYPGSVAIAFWITWLASDRKFGLAIPAGILTAISLIVFIFATLTVLVGDTLLGGRFASVFWPLLFIGIGLFALLSPVWTKVFKPSNAKDWEDWGEKFGKEMEKQGEAFGKKVESAFSPKDEKADVEEAEVVEKKTETEN